MRGGNERVGSQYIPKCAWGCLEFLPFRYVGFTVCLLKLICSRPAYFICPLVPSWASRGERAFCLRQV